eukprot:g56341.t1
MFASLFRGCCHNSGHRNRAVENFCITAPPLRNLSDSSAFKDRGQSREPRKKRVKVDMLAEAKYVSEHNKGHVLCRVQDLWRATATGPTSQPHVRAFPVPEKISRMPCRVIVVPAARDQLATDSPRGFLNRCPHAGLPLEMFPDEYEDRDNPALLVCSAHGARFEAATGLCVEGPCKGERLASIPLVSVWRPAAAAGCGAAGGGAAGPPAASGTGSGGGQDTAQAGQDAGQAGQAGGPSSEGGQECIAIA